MASLFVPCCHGGNISTPGACAANAVADKIGATKATDVRSTRMDLSSWRCSFRVVEAGLLQLGDRRDNPGREHDAVDKMIGEFGGERLVREPVRVHAVG